MISSSENPGRAPRDELCSNPYVRQILTGQVKHLGDPNAAHPMDRPWATGIFKSPVNDPIWLHTEGLENDEVGDTKNHGGPEKALFAYPLSHYNHWRTTPGLEAITIGGMGENLSVDHADENSVCVGDIYQFHRAVIQVSQPRQPCWRPARRFRKKDFALQIQQTGRTGWYFRVLIEGLVKGGVEIILQERPWPQWTVAACNDVMHHDTENKEYAAALASCPPLGESWKRTLQKRLEGHKTSIAPRVWGPNESSD